MSFFRPVGMLRSRIFTQLYRGRSGYLKSPIWKRLQSTGQHVAEQGKSGAPKPKEKGLKALVKEYGYSALGVYLGLSCIDLPICYLIVHSMGKDEIEVYENKAKQFFGFGMLEEELKKKQEIDRIHEESEATPDVTAKKEEGSKSILSQFSWTEFAIAYGLHKSLIFIRVPITAAITPGIVKVLRGWGFKIGSDKLSTTAAIAKDAIKDATASSPRFGQRPSGKKKWFNFFF